MLNRRSQEKALHGDELSIVKREPSRYVNFYQFPPMSSGSIPPKVISGTARPGSHFASFIAVPYCRVKCHSCPFFKELLPKSGDPKSVLSDYVDCLKSDMARLSTTGYFDGASCASIFLGGGTFSLLDPQQVSEVLQGFRNSFETSADIEITLEGNPKEFSTEYLSRVHQLGVNRLSIGLQSFNDETLRRKINSPHRASDSHTSLRNALGIGFDTVNVDLLFRLPGQTFEEWQDDLRVAVDYAPESITFYSYVVHEGSASLALIDRGTLESQVAKDAAHDWYIWSSNFLLQNGYVERMKGNFAKPGHEQGYGTLSYLEGAEIVGFGAGSYSFINRYLFGAPTDPGLYKEMVKAGAFPVANRISQRASDVQLMRRYIIFNFFASSINREQFARAFGVDAVKAFPGQFADLERHGLVAIDAEMARLTPLGAARREQVQYQFYQDC